MFDNFRPAPERTVDRDQAVPRRGMFAGLKLDATPAIPARELTQGRGQDRAFERAVERTSRVAEAVLEARATGVPILEHQKVALQRAIDALDTLRPRASEDMAEAMKRDPTLVHEAAAGRSRPMIDAMREEARVRADPNLRANRFVERWQALQEQRKQLVQSGDRAGAQQAGKALEGMAKGLERDPQMESLLRTRRQEMGLQREISLGRDLGRDLTQTLGRGLGQGLSL